MTERARRVEDDLDPSSQSARRFRHGLPDRLEDEENVLGGDFVDRIGANRLGVDGQRHHPLLRVLGIAPGRAMLGNEIVRDLAERRHAGRARFAGGLGAHLDGITPLAQNLTPTVALGPRLGKADPMESAEPHFPRSPGQGVSPKPSAALLGVNVEVKTAAVCVPSGLGLLGGLLRRQALFGSPRHSLPHFLPHFDGGAWGRTLTNREESSTGAGHECWVFGESCVTSPSVFDRHRFRDFWPADPRVCSIIALRPTSGPLFYPTSNSADNRAAGGHPLYLRADLKPFPLARTA